MSSSGRGNIRTLSQSSRRTRVALAAAAADGRAVGGGPYGLPAGFKEFMGDIARTTRDWVNERIAAAVQPLERRIVDLEARTYMGTWHAQTSYQAGALVTYDNSLWIARSDSAGVRPGTTRVWELPARKGAGGRPGRDAV
jgi:hypothetical protein